jgi:hypothetical protein
MTFRFHGKWLFGFVVIMTFTICAHADDSSGKSGGLSASPATPQIAEPDPADKADDAAPWLEYENTGSRLYTKVKVALIGDHTAQVFLDRRVDGYPFEYTARLSPAEMAWFRTLVRTTNFSNPKRREQVPAGGHGGITVVRARIDGQELQAKFARDDAFRDLARIVFRLVHQAEMIKNLEVDHHAYSVRTAITIENVFQPQAFVQPLTDYVLRKHHQLDHALVGLAHITTPEQWGGLVAQALEQATDEPYRDGSQVSRRRLLLQVIAGHPFYEELPVSHTEALLRIYQEQSAIESQKADDKHAALFVWRVQENEKRLKARN